MIIDVDYSCVDRHMMESHGAPHRADSGKKSLSVIDYKGRKCVIKVYASPETPEKEAAIMRAIGITGYAPEVVEAEGNYIIAEYVEGEDYATLFRRATMTDDTALLENLAGRLCIFLQMFYSLGNGYVLGKIDFDEFILSRDRCCCVSFASARKGMPFEDIAEIIAYAMCNAAGSCYSAYPFVRKMLDGFHLDAIGVVNDMGEYIDEYAAKHGTVVDKDAILGALMAFEDGDTLAMLKNTD